MDNNDGHCADYRDEPQGLQRTAHVISPPLLALASLLLLRCRRRSDAAEIDRPPETPGDRAPFSTGAATLAIRNTVYVPAMVTLRSACL
jgi:hypothetical protein